MTTKAVPINKEWFPRETAVSSPLGVFAWLKSALKFEVPVGYQDETGFHAGVKADEKEIKWPTTW